MNEAEDVGRKPDHMDNTPARKPDRNPSRKTAQVKALSMAEEAYARKRAYAQDAANRLARMKQENHTAAVVRMLLPPALQNDPLTIEMAQRIAGF